MSKQQLWMVEYQRPLDYPGIFSDWFPDPLGSVTRADARLRVSEYKKCGWKARVVRYGRVTDTPAPPAPREPRS